MAANEFSTQYDDIDLMFDSAITKNYPYSSRVFFTQCDNVFYSKFPITDFDSISIDEKTLLPKVEVKINNRYVSFIGCHFSSNNYIDSIHRMELDSVKSKRDFFTYVDAIDKGYKRRNEQVSKLCFKIQKDYKNCLKDMIILGDFNDVGGSYTVNKLEKLGLKDAWWEGGLGFGGTRDTGIFSFRLDHILYGSDMDLQSVKIIETNGLSDHKALFASFNLK